MKYHFLIPSRTEIEKGGSLNVLLGVEPTKEISYEFSFWGNDGSGWTKIHAEVREKLIPGEHMHLYFSLPYSCFSNSFPEVPEEVELSAGDSPDMRVKSTLIELV